MVAEPSETIRHSWDLTAREAIGLQRELATRILERPVPGPVRTVAGVDCAFLDEGRQIVAAAVLMDAATLEVIVSAYAVAAVRIPYIPGLLSFREAPAELEAIRELPEMPDLLLVDGAGRAHPRRLGIASHVGLWVGAATVGVARNPSAAWICLSSSFPWWPRRCPPEESAASFSGFLM